MFLASKIVWAGIVFISLTTGILEPRRTGISGSRPTLSTSGANLSKEELAAAHENDVKQMQQSLRDKGHYRGRVDGVFGLRTRASIRSYQKAENLTATGQLDTQTAGKLGVGPESSGGSFKGAGQNVGEGRNRTGHEIRQGKPSAGIEWAKGMGRASKKQRKEVTRAAGPESDRGDRANKQEAENERHDQ